jgi:hypothetical protein
MVFFEVIKFLLVLTLCITIPAIPPDAKVKTGLGRLFKVQSSIYKVVIVANIAAGATLG